MTSAQSFGFDESAFAFDDEALQTTARRQFGVSLIVAFAILVAAGLSMFSSGRDRQGDASTNANKVEVASPLAPIALPRS